MKNNMQDPKQVVFKKNFISGMISAPKVLMVVSGVAAALIGVLFWLTYNGGIAIQTEDSTVTSPDDMSDADNESREDSSAATTPVAATPATSDPAENTPTQNDAGVHFSRINEGEYANPSKGGDWLLVASDENIDGSELKGWSVKSLVSGKQFLLKDVSGFIIGPSEWSIFIHTAKDLYNNDRAMGGEIHMYFDESEMAWGIEHDTIQLLNSNGVVVDTIIY